MVAVLGYSHAEIAAAVREMYTAVATNPRGHFHFPVGREGCSVTGYPEELLEGLPTEAVESFAGVGCPFNARILQTGDRVLDIGSGAGVDSLIAARLAGSTGRVYALDMTPAMVEKLRRILATTGTDNIEVVEGTAENIPLPDASVDVITSNGVLNLVPNKRRAIREMFRVLRPGGRVQIADIVIRRPVTPDCLDDPKLWAECVVGATVDEDYLDMFRDAGFEDVEVTRSYDYFAHSPSAETREVAHSFAARAIELRMRRGEVAPRRATVFARRADPRRIARQLSQRGLWGIAALMLAAAACYGTLAAVAALALLGAAIVIDEGLWAATIVLLGVVTALFVAAGFRKHRQAGPAVPALLGAGVIAYTMFVSYDRGVEAAGFLLLGAGVAWDYLIRRYGSLSRMLRSIRRVSEDGLSARERLETSPGSITSQRRE